MSQSMRQSPARESTRIIYGQFIEHLGRCIYGGIWAEMLEDRKFYYPITDKYNPYRDLNDTKFPVVGASPWQVIGPAGSVTMEKENAFVGEHSPQGRGGRRYPTKRFGARRRQRIRRLRAATRPQVDRRNLIVSLAWGDGKSDRA